MRRSMPCRQRRDGGDERQRTHSAGPTGRRPARRGRQRLAAGPESDPRGRRLGRLQGQGARRALRAARNPALRSDERRADAVAGDGGDRRPDGREGIGAVAAGAAAARAGHRPRRDGPRSDRAVPQRPNRQRGDGQRQRQHLRRARRHGGADQCPVHLRGAPAPSHRAHRVLGRTPHRRVVADGRRPPRRRLAHQRDRAAAVARRFDPDHSQVRQGPVHGARPDQDGDASPSRSRRCSPPRSRAA